MPRQVRTLVLYGVLLSLCLGIGACGSSSDEILARVGDNTIRKSTFEHWISVTKGMSPAEAQALLQAPSSGMTLEQRVLGFLIGYTRTVAEAREAGVTVTDAETNAELARLHYERTQGLSFANQQQPPSFHFTSAETTSDRLWIIKVHMLGERVRLHRLAEAAQQIPLAQVTRYYSQHKADFVVPERRDVAVIQSFTKANSDAARREIESGRSLMSVVQRRNQENNIGGFRPGLTRRGLTHAYEKDYFTARPHVFVGPRLAEIYYLFEVTAVMPARQQRFEEVQGLIRQKLVAGAGRGVFTNILQTLDQQWRTKTRCRTAYQVAQCGGTLT